MPPIHPIISEIVWKLSWKLSLKIVNLERAFLHGDLEEEIYMDCPKGLDHDESECLLLLITMMRRST
jgi:hypothetical protein